MVSNTKKSIKSMKSNSKNSRKSNNNNKNKQGEKKDPIIKKIEKILNYVFEKGIDIMPKVETLTGKELGMLADNYAVVDKADGLRVVLYIDDTGKVYRLFNSLIFTDLGLNIGKTQKELHGSLIDTEYMENTDIYYAFDIIIHQSKDVRSLPFKDRYKCLLKFKDKLDKIVVKQFETEYPDFFKACQEVYYRPHPYNLDGLVFTPLDGSYEAKSLKWKPLKDLTIDFIVKIRKSYQENNKTYLILDLFVVMNKWEISRNNMRYPRNYQRYFPMIDNTFKMVPFPFMPEYDNTYSYCVIEVIDKGSDLDNLVGEEQLQKPRYYYRKVETETDDNKYRLSKVPVSRRRSINLIPIVDNSVVEFNYNINSRQTSPARKWVPYRYRQDRTVQYWTHLYNNEKSVNKLITGANSSFKANTIWKMYQDPITKDHIFGLKEIPKLYYVQTDIDRKNTRNMIQFHLWLKENLYKEYFFYKDYTENLLELSAGDGSDAANIVQQNPRYVLLIDLVATSLTKAQIDFKKFQNMYRNYETKVDILQLDLREDNIKKIVPYTKKNHIKYFEIVSIQFSFHYMMQTKQSFENLFKLIKTYTAPKGFYFMTCFDGATIYKMLKDKKEEVITVENQSDKILYKIEKMYDDSKEFDELDMFGTPINVFIYTIGGHIEYLVNFKKLVSYFKKNGFDLIDTKMFGKVAPTWERKRKMKLTEPEKRFSFLNRYAVFQKR